MHKGSISWLLAGIMLVAAVTVFGCRTGATPAPDASLEAEQPADDQTTDQQRVEEEPVQGSVTTPIPGLTIEESKLGKGVDAKPGDSVLVHYVGWLEDGTQFDSSWEKGQPYPFVLGAGQVIAGWDRGIEGMRVGGIRRLTIGPELAYGKQGAGGVIPPNATLVFEVELMRVN